MDNYIFLALVTTTVEFLNVLLEKLNENKIQTDFFNNCTKVKIKFLKENVNRIHTLSLKKSVLEILELCDKKM